MDINSESDRDHQLMKCLEAIYITSSGWKAVMLFLMPTVYKVLLPDYHPEGGY